MTFQLVTLTAQPDFLDFPWDQPLAAWQLEVFEFAIERIPLDLRDKLEPAETFHQILDHRWLLSETSGRDVGLVDAVDSYARNVLRYVPDERQVVASEDPDDLEPELYS